ncbi:hypothetical protein [Halarsenatibacter silvermanii]|uniref:Uncharacterized protein n=1 Tax=Halarsenatibacter silvermanii TaxID=321763 RepID=A0A1G9HRZ3_9FIRM|nr:hypothetical protein [Halarsenatibacter silvermanii]SDL15333.1 hypothetical protein SAMN04488692_10210 [Halarsenatibacter silvermanii]
MLKKACPQCGAESFSADGTGEDWVCPECGSDISDVKAERPE